MIMQSEIRWGVRSFGVESVAIVRPISVLPGGLRSPPIGTGAGYLSPGGSVSGGSIESPMTSATVSGSRCCARGEDAGI